MIKSISCSHFLNPKWIYSLLFLLTSYLSYAGGCYNVCGIGCGGSGCRLSAENKVLTPIRYTDTQLLNLKPSTTAKLVNATQSAITITTSDFQGLAVEGNTWIDFKNYSTSFSMNIGTVNTSSPQTFTLPANLLSYFPSYGRMDFVNQSSIPNALRVAGAEVALKTYFVDGSEHNVNQYYHIHIDNTGVYDYGTSYDFYSDSDDNFGSEPDYEYLDAPLDLNDVTVAIEEENDYVTNVCLTQYKETKTVNGFGTLVLPNGSSVDCLRIGIVKETRTRAVATDPFPTSATSIKNSIAFITKQGHYFQADISSQSGNNATLTNPLYRFIQATNVLEETSSVRLNNNSVAVSINATDDFAHPSSILDIQSDNKGVLMPRVTQANRPATPAEGLLIYQIDGTKGFYLYNGSAWERLLTDTPPPVLMIQKSPLIETPNRPDEGTATVVGKGALSNGSTFIKFPEIQEKFEDLIINIQLEGDCNGVYISSKTKEGFWVKELQKGKSNVKFSWSIH